MTEFKRSMGRILLKAGMLICLVIISYCIRDIIQDRRVEKKFREKYKDGPVTNVTRGIHRDTIKSDTIKK